MNVIRKELQLRSADAVCGFLAQLKANLTNLQRAAYSPGSSREVWHSVFLSFCDATEKINIMKLRPEGDVCFAGDKSNDVAENHDWKKFEKCANKTLELFHTSSGQVPLSKEMFNNFGDIQMILQDMLICKKHKLQMQQHELHCSKVYTKGPVGSKDSIEAEMKNFDKLTNDIITDIDNKTEKLLGELWDRLKN